MASPNTYSKVGIVSNACVLLGEQPCSSLTEDRYSVTVGANLFDNLYENELQTAARWRFAMEKKALSRVNTTPLNEYQYVYQIPTSTLLLIGVYPRTNYEVYGKHIYSNNTSCEIEHLFKPELSQIPAYFALLLTYELRVQMINPVTEGGVARQEVARKEANVQRAKSQYADAQARPNRPIADSPFTDVR